MAGDGLTPLGMNSMGVLERDWTSATLARATVVRAEQARTKADSEKRRKPLAKRLHLALS